MSRKKPQIKVKLVDFWRDDMETHFWLTNFLSQKYDIVFSDEPDYVFYSWCGYEHLKYDCVRIAYMGENIRIDWNVADYGIECCSLVDLGERYLRVPYCFVATKEHRPYDFSTRKLNKRDKFCSYLVSNGQDGDLFRDRFFDKLSKYKRVDSGGKWRNNIGGTFDKQYSETKVDFLLNKQKWLENYKFNICFENCSYPGYLSEKFFDAYIAGCIPIYWGDTSLRIGFEDAKNGKYNPQDLDCIDMRMPKISKKFIDFKLNPKAFINAHNFPNLNALVEEVKRIDNDEEAYKTMRNESLFLDNFDMNAFYEKKLWNFFDNIFSQNPNLAFRRGDGLLIDKIYIRRIKDMIANVQKFENLSKNAKKTAKFVNKIDVKVRNFRHKIRNLIKGHK